MRDLRELIINQCNCYTEGDAKIIENFIMNRETELINALVHTLSFTLDSPARRVEKCKQIISAWRSK